MDQQGERHDRARPGDGQRPEHGAESRAPGVGGTGTGLVQEHRVRLVDHARQAGQVDPGIGQDGIRQQSGDQPVAPGPRDEGLAGALRHPTAGQVAAQGGGVGPAAAERVPGRALGRVIAGGDHQG